jgi:hypothetical protein
MLVNVRVNVPLLEEDRTTEVRDAILRAFQEPDMADSIAEAIGRYTENVAGDDTEVVDVTLIGA